MSNAYEYAYGKLGKLDKLGKLANSNIMVEF